MNRPWIWGLLAAAAVLWPARLHGPFDGIPLDGAAEAIVVGMVMPALLWFHGRFLTTRFARACVIALILWKAMMAAAVTPDGWCVRFVPSRPLAKDTTGAPHSWDVRADWRSADPACSAIMTRPYEQLSEFPVWFFNLPPPNNSWPGPLDRPPGATLSMTVSGTLRARAAGVLQIVTSRDVAAAVRIDDETLRPEATRGGVMLTPGVHSVRIDATLTGDRWRFEPHWNGADLWRESVATVSSPSRVDQAVRPWGNWVVALLVVSLTLGWLASAVERIRDADVLTWTIGAAAWIGLLAALGHDQLARWSIVFLLGATLLRVPARLRNVFGAFVLIGVPWLTLITVLTAPEIGRFRLYGIAHDYWMYQRWAYRVALQGYWLEGGSPVFQAQPFYRWIVAALHLVFGDSSVGESYWDAACVLVMALCAFSIVKIVAGFRWGIAATTMTLAVFALGTTWGHLGLGLSETSATGFVYLAALLALKSRRRSWGIALAAGALATLSFYTRLNNLPVAIAVAVFALPILLPARTLFRPAIWWRRVAWPTIGGVYAALAAGLLFFAWRTWYYSGVFSVFHGTSLSMHAAWRPGMSVVAYVRAAIENVLMVLTMNMPPKFEPYSLPLLGGFLVALGAIAGVPRLRELPLGAVLFCLAGISGFLVASDAAYPGRFSIHLIGITSALVTCSAALLCRTRFTRSTPRSS